MRPFSLLIKPAGPDCNLNCRYCFYSDKTCLFGEGRHRMSDATLETMVREYLSLGFSPASFAWQGGEPTLMGLDFFKRAVELQRTHGHNGQMVSNALQTNGVLLDDEWCRFLDEYQFLVGISVDGPRELHDHYRKDFAGNGTWERVMAGIDACRRNRVQFNTLFLVNDLTVEHPDELFDFALEHNLRYVQFIPCVEPDPETGKIASFAVKPEAFGRFLCRIFDRWLEYGPTKLSVRLFDSMLTYCLQGRHTVCTFQDRCQDYIVVEHDGTTYCCDFFVEDRWRIGHIDDMPIGRMIASPVKREFARAKRRTASQCSICRHAPLCCGGCLKDRVAMRGRYDDVSYLCGAYKMFFDHTRDKFMELAADVSFSQRAMQGQDVRTSVQVGVSDKG